MAGAVVPLVGGSLYLLANCYLVDGRVSTHPPDARAYSSMNVYLAVAGTQGLLIDAGLSVHERAILEQIDSLANNLDLSLWAQRFGEFNGLCNARPIADKFGLKAIYSRQPSGHPSVWLDFRPDYVPYGHRTSGNLTAAESRVARGGTVISLDPDGLRQFDVMDAPLRLLPTFWTYDRVTRTLFTSDMFTWVDGGEDGPWILTGADDDPTTQTRVESSLFGNRYWWLPGANTGPLLQDLTEVFERYDVDTIAPAYGCVLQGPAVVRRHVALLSQVLEAAPGREQVVFAADGQVLPSQA